MVKTQVQFPDHLYREAKRVAVEQEMSFAEVVRRGLEIAVQGYPPGRVGGEGWSLPSAKRLGRVKLLEKDWVLASRDST
ncbi:MAG: hypothetical protein ACEQSM_03910 [Aliarcobacter sp.]